jgi:hypothetical protein
MSAQSHASGMSVGQRVARALARAVADGKHPHHVSLNDPDWAPLGLPQITLKPAPKAAASVLWAMDAKGFKLTPYLIDEA